jgi:hypothetical protein
VGGYLEVRLGDDAVDASQLLVDLPPTTKAQKDTKDEEMVRQRGRFGE